jgi:MFS family permease
MDTQWFGLTHHKSKLNTKQKGIIRTFWIVWGIREFSMSFFATTYVLFLLSRGLNLLEANLVNTVFFITLFLFEIPTGVVADVYGRKASTVISYLLLGMGTGIYFFADSFWACALAEAISAIGMTFATGAFDAWLVDELKYHGYEGKTQWIFSRGQQIGKITGLVSAMIGSWLGSVNLAIPWIASGLSLIIGGLLAIVLMREQSFQRRPYSMIAGWREMGLTFKAGLSYVKQSTAIRFLIVMGLVQSFSVMAANMQWTPWFSGLLKGSSQLGFIWWGIAIAIVFGSELANRISKTSLSEKQALIATNIAIGIGIALAALWQNFAVGISIFLFHELFRGMYKPLKDAYLNANIPSEQRATLISFDAMAFHVGGAVGSVVSGWLANSYGIPTAWMVSGLSLVLGTLLIAKNGLKKH